MFRTRVFETIRRERVGKLQWGYAVTHASREPELRPARSTSIRGNGADFATAARDKDDELRQSENSVTGSIPGQSPPKD